MQTLKRVIVATIFATVLLPHWVAASWQDKQHGFAILPSSRESLCTENFFQTVRNLKSIGVSIVTLRVPWSQQTITDSQLYRYRRTPNDDALECGIEYIQSEGLEFGLDLVINTTAWRASIDPDDRDLWFESMGVIAEKYAREFAEPFGASHFSLGTEMYRVVSNEYDPYNAAAPGRYRWPEIIADVREHYSGTLTYSAQHSGDRSAVFEDNDLISNVDVLAFSAYWPLFASDLGSLLLEWARIERDFIIPARELYNKRIVFGEVGYRPCDYTFERPYDPDSPCVYDGEAQALAWEALLTYFADTPYLDGLTGAWLWRDNPDIGGIGDTGYTPWGKPALDVIKRFWIEDDSPETPDPDQPFGASQAFGVPYCDQGDTNIPDHGWGNMNNYIVNGLQLPSAGCIYQGSNADNIYGDSSIGLQGSSVPVPTPTEPEPTPVSGNPEFPFGVSQLSAIPYCDPADTNVPDHGWGNLSNYSTNGESMPNQGCIYPEGPSDNQYGDPVRGYIPADQTEPTTSQPSPPPPNTNQFAFGESLKVGVPYCDPVDQNIPSHGWGNMQNYSVNGVPLDAVGCIYINGPADNAFGDPSL